MSNIVISVKNASNPAVLLNALQRTIVTAQVHRRNNWWDYEAVGLAQAELTMPGFQLYMYLERQNTRAPWSVWPKKTSEVTQLNEFNLPGALLELKKRGYLTSGKIEMDGEMYETSVYHFWEHPELCDIDYSDAAA